MAVFSFTSPQSCRSTLFDFARHAWRNNPSATPARSSALGEIKDLSGVRLVLAGFPPFYLRVFRSVVFFPHCFRRHFFRWGNTFSARTEALDYRIKRANETVPK